MNTRVRALINEHIIVSINNPLQQQVASRLDHHIVAGATYGTYTRQTLLELVIQRLRLVPEHRIPHTATVNSETGYPDSYIDRLIKYSILEGPELTTLKAGDDAAWKRLYRHIYEAAYIRARKYLANGTAPEYRDLASDFAQQCAEIVYSQLVAYYFDVPFERWVSSIVSKKIIDIIRPTRFYAEYNHLSFDYVPDDDNRLPLEELIADKQAFMQFILIEKQTDLETGLSQLPPRYQQIIKRRLNGEPVASIAADMDMTSSGVSKLTGRALVALNEALQVTYDA